MQEFGETRFSVDDYVIYGGNGVCLVEDICTLDGKGIDSSRIYYRLKPLYERGSMVYAPVDNLKNTLRELPNKEETLALMDEFADLETISFQNDKTLDNDYKAALQSYGCRELMQVMKTAFLRIKQRQDAKKKVVMVDEKYYNRAKELLFGELAVILHTTREGAEEYFKQHIDELGMESSIA